MEGVYSKNLEKSSVKNAGKSFKMEGVLMKNKIDLHIGLKRTVLFEKYSIEHEKKLFLLEMLDGCEIKLHEYFPNFVFYVKSDILLFEQGKTHRYLFVNLQEIWSFFEYKYSMNYKQIQSFVKCTLEKPLKWKEFTPKRQYLYLPKMLKKPL